MSRFRLFMENFLVYGLGGVISKIIPIIMLPIVTRLMPNTEYFGINDISTIIVSFGSAIAIMGMYDAMFRMFFDKDDRNYQGMICSSALAFTTIMSIILFVILYVFKDFFSKIFFGSIEYKGLIGLSALSILVGGTNSIVAAPTRMQNKRKIYLLTNTLSPVISYGVSIPLLLKGHFVIALPLASLLSAFSMEGIFYFINRKWFSFKKIEKKYIKQMLLIGLPLLPNFLIYWIFNSADRIMIGNLLDNGQVGIYGIGARIGQMSQLIYTAFAGGWQFFAFSTMKDKDQVKMTSNIYEYLGALAFSAFILVTAFMHIIFSIFFEGDYIKGEIVAPYLFLAPLLLMLYQTASNQLLVIKKTWPQIIVLFLGAFCNIIINLVLIPCIGIEGAAIGTLLGYVISNVACIILLNKIKLISLTSRFYKIIIVTILYFIIWRFYLNEYIIYSISFAFLAVLIIIYIYRADLRKLIKK